MNKDSKLTKIFSVLLFISIIISAFSSIISKYKSPLLIYLPFLVVTIYIITFIFTNIIKHSKSHNNNLEDDIANKIKKDIEKEKQNSMPTMCSYCGATYSNEENKCPNCGAKKQ